MSIKILYLVPNLRVANGVATYAMNYFRNIDKSKYQIDFLQKKDFDTPYYKEIQEAGGHVYTAPNYKNVLSFIKFLKEFFKDNKYDILHCHMINFAIPILYYAKKNKLASRVLHSHVIVSGETRRKKFISDILLPISVKLSNNYVACTEKAGRFMFGNKNFRIIKNAIDIEKYAYKESIRFDLKKQMDLENKYVIGTVARMVPSKNPFFIIDVMDSIVKQSENNICLLWVGTGYMKEEVEDYVHKKNLSNNIIFIGDSNKTEELYQVMDVFFLPSKYEGLGIVYIEAQAAGLTTFASDNVPQDTKVSRLIHYISLNAGADLWAKEILTHVNDNRNNVVSSDIKNHGYDICDAVKELELFYDDVVKI